MARFALIAMLIASAVFLAAGAEAKVVDEHIYLFPAGDADARTVEAVKKCLPACLPMTVRVKVDRHETITESAYAAPRRQYLAEMILGDIAQRINLDTGTESALIITDVDLYSPDFDFVFGVADRSKFTGLISLARLRNEYYGLRPDNTLFTERAVKEALHELGHTWGLAHCKNPKCAMSFSNYIADIDKKRSGFCLACKRTLHNRYTVPIFKKRAK
ncbi:MAG: archaemetzincin family Zn-dependent metalloprotease [Candidatus Omnitrophota bacterium]